MRRVTVAVLVAVGLCSALRKDHPYDVDCGLFAVERTNRGGNNIAVSEKTFVVPKSALHFYCVGVKTTGCGEDVKASAHFEYFERRSDSDASSNKSGSRYSETPTSSFHLTKLLGGVVDYLPLFFHAPGYWIVRFRKGISSDGEPCPGKAEYWVRTRDINNTLQRHAVIVDVSPSVVGSKDNVTLWIYAPPNFSISLFEGVHCEGELTKTIAAGATDTFTVTLPDTDDYEYSVCYEGGKPVTQNRTDNALRVIVRSKAFFLRTEVSVGHSTSPGTYRLYHPSFRAGARFKLVDENGDCDLHPLLGTVEGTLKSVVECGRPVLQTTVRGANYPSGRRARVCVMTDNGWVMALNITNQKPTMQAYIRCNFSNDCENEIMCPLPKFDDVEYYDAEDL